MCYYVRDITNYGLIMDKSILSVKVRDVEKDKLGPLRLSGMVPACLYGAGQENLNLSLNKNDFVRLFKTAGSNTIVEMDVEGVGKENVLIYDVSYEPVSDEVEHVDFIRVRMDEKITTKIPLEFVGQSKAVKELAGIFNANIDEVEVTCLPGKLPKVIEVNIDKLNTFDDAINIKDLVVPDGVVIENEADGVVASVLPPRSEEELAALNEDVTENVEAVEVEEKGKKEEEEEVEGGEKKEEKKE
jgi:large subunit ribosomal protein L25